MGDCHSLTSNVTFSDRADRSILDHSFLLPESGTFKATTTLSSQLFSTLNGNWTLGVFDTMKDGLTGSLLGWKLDIETEYCDQGVQWFHLPTVKDLLSHGGEKDVLYNEDFTPRHSHASIAVRNNVYVLGGYSQRFHNGELWRFNYDSKTWIRLHSTSYRPKLYGQSTALTPFGLIVLGGLNSINGQSQLEQDMYHMTMVRNSSSRVLEVHESSKVKPQERYFSSITYIGDIPDYKRLVEDNSGIQSHAKPSILLFGGDTNLLEGTYLDDIWSLSLEGTQEYEKQQASTQECQKLLYPDKHENNPWEWKCGFLADVNSRYPCQWKDVMKMAWCLRQY